LTIASVKLLCRSALFSSENSRQVDEAITITPESPVTRSRTRSWELDYPYIAIGSVEGGGE